MYNHQEIEKKWQEYWKQNNTFKTSNTSLKPKYYCLDMFPYPSGAGLHVGHPEGMTANDIVARYKHAKGHNVLHPMGWDAFGLPAENYAIKTGTHPRITTDENIQTFKRQIQSLGFSYDWDREIDTTDPEYFKWTQWIFLKLFEKGLAYEQDLPINYCPSCKTGLANEEVLGDFSCERCGTQVEKKKIRQWVLAITKYAERLLSDVDDLDWPEGIKDMQRNWIGKSQGCEFELKKSDDDTKSIRVYTTRVDTVFGMTYAVIAPDHPDVEQFIAESEKQECEDYISKAGKQSDQDRTADDKEKTGVFTGSYVINPYNGEQVPLWIADYVLGSYGTGAVMAVPAHDERDFEFAKKYDLEIRTSVATKNIDFGVNESTTDKIVEFDGELFVEPIENRIKASTAYGRLVNSGEFNGLTSEQAKEKFVEIAEEKGFGHKTTNYKLRDWLFSRQRYWGEPIPLIHLDEADIAKLPTTQSDEAWVRDGDMLMIGKKEFSKIYDGIYGKIVCDYELPLKLPEVDAYEPAGDGTSPLTKVDEFVNVELAANLKGKRETNTMPQWGGSCWYYLRFMDAKNPEELVGSEVEKYWGNVDSYVGGAEHAVLHLLYARFWHKFLYDIGVVSTSEPFHRLRNQGMITAYSFEDLKGKLVPYDMIQNIDGELILDENGELIEKNILSDKKEKFFHTETKELLKMVIAKMSKSLKNVVNPDKIIHEYGADSLRLYEMYMADFSATAPWNTGSIIGVKRFLDKFYAMMTGENPRPAKSDDEAMKTLHKTIKKIEEDIENYKFNTAIAQMMILLNTGEPKDAEKNLQWKRSFVQLLHPFAPHMAEECWEILDSKTQSYDKIYFATGNTSKIERAQKLLSKLNSDAVVEKYSDIIDVEETGKTSLECALQKLEIYKGKEIDVPIAVADSSIHFENADFDIEPTKVKRTALELAGKIETECSQEEIAELMIAYYQEKATQAGGKLDYYYIDSWAVLYPNGEIKTLEYRREYTLTNKREGELNPYFPMNSLYISKYSGKRNYESTDEDFFIEHAGQLETFSELFGYQGNSIFFTAWPEYDEAMTVDNEVTIGVQVLGKLRGEITIAVGEDKDSVLEKARNNESVAKWLEGKNLVKEIYVPGKIVNLVVK